VDLGGGFRVHLGVEGSSVCLGHDDTVPGWGTWQRWGEVAAGGAVVRTILRMKL
jgi:hypothetical protein